jgi:beta-fructofuranosidase
MTIPRELSFRDGRLWQQPVRELEQYYTNIISYKKVPVSDEISLYGVEGRTIDLEVTVRPAPGEPLYRKFAIWFAMDQENHSAVRFTPDDGTVKIDRKNAGSRKAIVHQRRCLVRESMDGSIRLRIILDRNSFEVFINDGRYVMSATIPTPLAADKISFRTEGKSVIDVTKREIRIS